MAFDGAVRIEFFPDRVDNLLNSPVGPVSAATARAATAVLRASRRFITHTWPTDTYGRTAAESRPLKDTGRIVHAGGSATAVQFTSPHALVHHEGRDAQTGTGVPYTFRSKGNKRILPGALARTYYTSPVSPNRYLVKGARSVGLTIRRSAALGRDETLFGRLRGVTIRSFIL